MRTSLENNYFYYGRAISKQNFLANVDNEAFEIWQNSGVDRVLNDFTWGGYTATAVTDESGETL